MNIHKSVKELGYTDNDIDIVKTTKDGIYHKVEYYKLPCGCYFTISIPIMEIQKGVIGYHACDKHKQYEPNMEK